MQLLLNYIFFINEFIKEYYLFVLITYFISLICFYSFSLPGSPIFSIASGFFFGFYIGFFINIASILVGSFIFVYIAKYFFKKLFKKYYTKFSEKINTLLKDSTYEYLILLRLIFGTPLFLQNLCLSFANISKTKFYISSFLGISPWMILFTYTGSKISSLLYLEEFQIKNILSFNFFLF